MSQVFMCDSCSSLFSVNEKGWKEFTEKINVVESNAYNHGMRVLHMCPQCAPTGGPEPLTPSIRSRVKDAIPTAFQENSKAS